MVWILKSIKYRQLIRKHIMYQDLFFDYFTSELGIWDKFKNKCLICLRNIVQLSDVFYLSISQEI